MGMHSVDWPWVYLVWPCGLFVAIKFSYHLKKTLES